MEARWARTTLFRIPEVYPKTGLLASIRRILCDRSAAAHRLEWKRTTATLARVYAHVNPDSRASFHKFLPADVLPRITARRFTAKPRVGKIVFTASGYTYGSYEDEEEKSAGDAVAGTASPGCWKRPE